MSDTQQELLAEYKEDLLGVFGDPSLVFERGNGSYLYDANGKKYLDLLAGIAVNALGHAHPDWVKTVTQQAGKLAHISNFFTSPPQLELAHRLRQYFNAQSPSQVFFCNSGTEANEAAYKLARTFGNQQDKPVILALENAFHGRTIGALSLSWKETYRAPFEPLPRGIKHIPATLEALEEHLNDDVAAIIVEPIQGEAGVIPLPEGYLQRARELTRANNALLIVDEVQTGMGRTGRWFECSRELDSANMPDVVTLAKGLGGGFPIGAMVVCGEENLNLLQAGMHGTTFGGNPLASAVALTTLDVIERDNLCQLALERGRLVRKNLEQIETVDSTSGAGLLIGIQLKNAETSSGEPLAPACVNVAREKGFIINATNPSTLRIAPPLIISDEELAQFSNNLAEIIEQAARQ